MRRKNVNTDFLMDCIADALILLLREKPMEQITISEITRRADVGRATFYRNFATKEQVLGYKLHRLGVQWFTEKRIQDFGSYETLVVSFFSFLLFNRDTVQLLYDRGQWPIVLDFFHNALCESVESRANMKALMVYQNEFFSYGMFGLTSAWIRRGFQETPEKMGLILTHELWELPQSTSNPPLSAARIFDRLHDLSENEPSFCGRE